MDTVCAERWGKWPLLLAAAIVVLGTTARAGTPIRIRPPGETSHPELRAARPWLVHRPAQPGQANPPVTYRYTAQWADGTRESADTLGPWNQPKSVPKLGNRELLDPQRPLRWLVDNSLAPAPAPDAVVEFCGGDCLPGRVIGFRDGTEGAYERLPPHLLVAASVRTAWPERLSHPEVRVTLPWVRRIVWQRVAERYQPRSLFFADGRQLEFRSIRFTPAGLQVLRHDGVQQFGFGDLAEVHLPPVDPWEAYFQQLAALGLEGDDRLVRLETSAGLRATSSTEQYQPRSGGSNEQPSRWYHMVQPPWSLDPLWLKFDTIRVREYFLPHDVPLSRIEPSAARGQSDLGGVWRWQRDRNVEAGPLEAGGTVFPWGFGVHAESELEFPLCPLVRAFRTRFGLDELAGKGGCVRAKILVQSSSTKTLYTSELLVGSGKVLDTGRLPVEVNSASGRLILQVDPAHADRPPGADPLDIRDVADWLEPMVELDPEKLDAEVLRRGPQMIAAWQNWKVVSGDSEAVRLVRYWDRADREDAAYRVMAVLGQQPLRLTGEVLVRPYRDRLLLAVSRPSGGRATRLGARLEVRVDGEPLGRFEIPARSGGQVRPLVVSLARYHGRQVTVELIHEAQAEGSAVDWEAISLVGRTAVPP
jgi:hypothetical protein